VTARQKVNPRLPSPLQGQITAMVRAPAGSGTGVRVMEDEDATHRVVRTSDQVQEIVVEALWAQRRPAAWHR
jgi:hypothetical protein